MHSVWQRTPTQTVKSDVSAREDTAPDALEVCWSCRTSCLLARKVDGFRLVAFEYVRRIPTPSLPWLYFNSALTTNVLPQVEHDRYRN